MIPAVKVMVGYMKVAGLTQKELAVVLGADAAQVSKWVTGKHNPCRAWQMRIANVLGEIPKPSVGKMERLKHEDTE